MERGGHAYLVGTAEGVHDCVNIASPLGTTITANSLAVVFPLSSSPTHSSSALRRRIAIPLLAAVSSSLLLRPAGTLAATPCLSSATRDDLLTILRQRNGRSSSSTLLLRSNNMLLRPWIENRAETLPLVPDVSINGLVGVVTAVATLTATALGRATASILLPFSAALFPCSSRVAIGLATGMLALIQFMNNSDKGKIITMTRWRLMGSKAISAGIQR